MKKTKKIKQQPLFEKKQLKGISERYNLLKQVFSASTLDELLDLEIKNRMMKNYLNKNGIDYSSIEKEYEKEIKSINETIRVGNSLVNNKNKK